MRGVRAVSRPVHVKRLKSWRRIVCWCRWRRRWRTLSTSGQVAKLSPNLCNPPSVLCRICALRHSQNEKVARSSTVQGAQVMFMAEYRCDFKRGILFVNFVKHIIIVTFKTLYTSGRSAIQESDANFGGIDYGFWDFCTDRRRPPYIQKSLLLWILCVAKVPAPIL